MNEDALPLIAFTNWLPPEEWADDHEEFIQEIGKSYEDVVERSFNSDLEALSEEEAATLTVVLAKIYLAEAGPSLVKSFKEDFPDAPAEALSFLRAVAKSRPSVYEVVEARPASHYLLLDLVAGGDPIRLPTESAPEEFFLWDLILGRMVKVGRRQILTLGTPILPREYVPNLRKAVREAEAYFRKDDPSLTPEEVANFAVGFLENSLIHAWLATSATRRAGPPALENMDGDVLEIVSLAYPIKGNPEPVSRALTNAEDFVEQDPINWVWLQEFKGSTIVHANLRLEGDRLLAECNSGKRSKKLTARLEKLVGSRLGRPLKMKGTVEREMSMPSLPPPSTEEPLDPAMQAELDALLRQQLATHYMAQLDEVVPMIEGRPRRLVKTEEGREKVVTWLKFLENSHEREKLPQMTSAPDFTPLWSELGLLAYRNSPRTLFD